MLVCCYAWLALAIGLASQHISTLDTCMAGQILGCIPLVADGWLAGLRWSQVDVDGAHGAVPNLHDVGCHLLFLGLLLTRLLVDLGVMANLAVLRTG